MSVTLMFEERQSFILLLIKDGDKIDATLVGNDKALNHKLIRDDPLNQ